MSWLWLLFASLTVVGSLMYNIGMKFGSPTANPFGFSFALTTTILVVQGICCLIAKYAFGANVTQGLNGPAFKFALLCGAAAALIDVAFFMALRYGALVPTQLMWTVGGSVALATFSLLFLGDSLTPTKAAGLLLGLVSLFLITK